VVTGAGLQFLVVGDATLDVTVTGGTPVPGADRPAAIQVGSGGQGANVAVRLARRGHRVRLVTAIGTEPIGAELASRLSAEGVEVANLGAARTGIVIALLDAGGERAMLSDRAAPEEGAWSRAVAATLGDADWIHVSGYPLADPGSGPALARAVGDRRPGQRASVGGGSFSGGRGLVDCLVAARPDLVLFDRAEAAVAAGMPAEEPRPGAAELAGRLHAAFGAFAVVTDGPAGAVATIGPETVAVSGEARALVDATGAGDAHAAALLDALAGGPWPPSASDVRHALEVAGPVGAEVAGLLGAQARTRSEAPA
jgi:sugar/nucleoside kinase (ribokinase family)